MTPMTTVAITNNRLWLCQMLVRCTNYTSV